MMSLRTIRQFTTLPSPAARGPMPPIVSVIIAVFRVNLILNPSFETNTTNYTAVGGSIARSAAQQYHGTYSLAITPSAGTNSDGAYYGPITLNSGQAYAFSCKVRGVAGINYVIGIKTTGAADLSIVKFTATGRWQWISGYYTEATGAARRFYFTKDNNSNTGVFSVDGVQIEAINAGELVSTYIDGDQSGLLIGQVPPAYLWTGTPHASTSSRSAVTRAGGYVVNLSTYNFILTGLIGLGMAIPNNVSIPYTVLDGARYERTTKPPRTISLPGRFQADDDFGVLQGQSDMRAAFDRDAVPIQQPLLLMVEPQDACGNVIGDFAQIQCLYAGGLEGNDSNLPIEDVAMTFTMYLPFVIAGDGGASLNVQQSIANTRAIIKRNTDGTWAAMGTGAAAGASVYNVLVARDGKIYAAGSYTAMGGVANTAGLAYFDPTDSAWHAMGTGPTGGAVWTLAEGPDGSIYAGGDFTSMGGVANTKCIARWTGSAWAAMGTGGVAATTQVRALQFNNTGTLLYVGGNFTDIGGSGADYLATWSGAAWAVVGSATALNGTVLSLARRGPLGIYVGGQFTNASAIANADYIALWSGTAYSALGTGMNSDVQTIIVRPNDVVYAGGAFTIAGGITVAYNAQWNGNAWSPLGPGLNALMYALGSGPGQTLYYGGGFSTAGGYTLNDGLALWLGTVFAFPDIDLGGTAGVFSIAQLSDGTLYLGSDSSTPATAAGITAVTNPTPNVVYPRLVMKGPSSGTSRIYQLINRTTGFGVYLDLTLSAGETATLNTDPSNFSFVSDFQGDLTRAILPGSQRDFLYLAPGANSISFFAAAASVTATMSWRNQYNGIADLVN